MKALFFLIVIVVIACAALYFYGGYSSYDPTEEGRQARAAVSPGMSLEQVIEAIDQPRAYVEFIKTSQQGQEFVKPSPEMGFTLENVRYRIDNNEVPEGFYIVYYYSPQASFQVHFDSTGVVTQLTDNKTIADLLQTRE